MASLRNRLTLLHVAIVVVVLAVAALAGRWSLSKAVNAQLDAALLALAETEAATLNSAPDQPVRVHEVEAGPQPPSLVRLDRLVQIMDADGRVLARSQNLGEAQLPESRTFRAQINSRDPSFDTLPDFAEEPLRRVSLPVLVRGKVFVVQVAGSLDDVRHVLRATWTLFVILAVVLAAAIGISGSLMTGRVFRAINGIVAQSQTIRQDNLTERLPKSSSNDEIGALVDTLNAMLARLEHSFTAQRQFTANASHELRSPLSRLRAELEVTLRRPREAQDYIDALRSCLTEVERMTELVGELLLLARLDSDQERSAVVAYPMSPLILNAIDRLRQEAGEKQVSFAIDALADVSVSIPQSHINLILINLLDNAFKFSPSGAVVRVALLHKDSEVILRVSDAGPGLDPDEMPQLFDRFFRGTSARSAEVPGTGLGLSLCQAIVTTHGGHILVGNVPGGGATVTVHLPAVS